jgi:hypothetical protein
MQLRDHLLTSVITGLARYPRSPGKALLVLLAGVVIDLDHFLVYALQTGDWTLAGALQYDQYRHTRPGEGDTRPRYGSLRSWLHRPELLLPLWWLARVLPILRPIALGITLHLLLDHRYLPEELLVLAQARGRCARCAQAARLKTRWAWQPEQGRRVLIAVCEACIEQHYSGVV